MMRKLSRCKLSPCEFFASKLQEGKEGSEETPSESDALPLRE